MVAFNFKASTPKLTKCIALDSVTCPTVWNLLRNLCRLAQTSGIKLEARDLDINQGPSL